MKQKIYIILVFALLCLPVRAFAQCETPASAMPALNQLELKDGQIISKYATQEMNFVKEKLGNTALYEVKARLDEFDGNIRAALMAWNDEFIPVLKKITKQLSVAQVAQTFEMGAMMDAQLLNEAAKRKTERHAEARRRYGVSETSCQVDSVGTGQTKAYEMARAVNHTIALEGAPRRGNAEGSISATGTGAEIRALWDEYETKFCDNTKGDQGCTAPGTLAGRHKDLPALLWGDRQTIDLSNDDNRLVVDASMRYLVSPQSADPILPGAVNSASGHQELLARRAEEARRNAIYNAIGQMVGERAGGSGVNAQSMRIAAGTPAAEASTDASYRELQATMSRDRFYNPEYIQRLVGNPELTVREQVSVNALRLQMLNDIYRRSEEFLFMEAAGYSRELDGEMPSSAIEATPLR